jgi:hypothetical protein
MPQTLACRSKVPPVRSPDQGKMEQARPGSLQADWYCYLFAIFLGIVLEKQAME